MMVSPAQFAAMRLRANAPRQSGKIESFPIITGILLAGSRINTGDFSGNAVVTIELILGCKWVQTETSEKSPLTMRQQRRLASIAQPMQTHPKCPKRPFHGDNTGSNPVGDANKINNLASE